MTSSVLTNTSAMIALQNLRSTNAGLEGVNNQISTGKKVATAKDNAAVFAISKTMQADVKGFKGISDSLALGQSTLSVGRQAAESVTDLLTEMKGKIVAAQEENVDRAKIQTDIEALNAQIRSVVGAAQFNGLNLVQDGEDVDILSSLDRGADGAVTANDITVRRQDLTQTVGTLGTGAGLTDLTSNVAATATTISNAAVRTDAAGTDADVALAGDLSDGAVSFDINGTVVSFGAGELSATATTAGDQIAAAINAAQIEGITAVNNAGTLEFSSTKAFEATTITANSAASGTVGGAASATVELTERAESFTFSASATVNEGDGYRFALSGGVTGTYVASAGDTMEDVVRGLKLSIDAANDENIAARVAFDDATGAYTLQIDNDAATAETLTLTANDDANANATTTGRLAGLGGFDVTTESGAEAALANVETLIQRSIDSAAAFGSVQGRIEIQENFVGKLTDALTAGIGSLVDADLEEASARLQALQVQQQLGVQALSIANQAPQTILALFR